MTILDCTVLHVIWKRRLLNYSLHYITKASLSRTDNLCILNSYCQHNYCKEGIMKWNMIMLSDNKKDGNVPHAQNYAWIDH